MAKSTKKKTPVPPAKPVEAPVVTMVDYRLIDEDPYQPRKIFDSESLEELAALIDVYAIAKEVENETGHTFPELELINQPKEAAEA